MSFCPLHYNPRRNLYVTTRVTALVHLPDVSFLLQDNSLDPYSLDLTDINEAAGKCLGSGELGAVVELERKVLELHEHQKKVQEQDAHEHKGKGAEESYDLIAACVSVIDS